MKRNELIQGILQNIGSMSRLAAPRLAQKSWPRNMPTHAQLGIMFVLMHQEAEEKSGIKELAARFRISSSAATQLVNGMEAEGLLSRSVDTEDRRSVRIGLTQKGKRKLAAAQDARLKMMAEMFEPLSDKELSQFLDLQRKMSDRFMQTWPKK